MTRKVQEGRDNRLRGIRPRAPNLRVWSQVRRGEYIPRGRPQFEVVLS
jgi:hypothetical protein